MKKIVIALLSATFMCSISYAGKKKAECNPACTDGQSCINGSCGSRAGGGGSGGGMGGSD